MAKRSDINTTSGEAITLPTATPLPVVAPPAVYMQMVDAARDFAKAGLGKDGVNEQQKFKFRGIDSLMNLAAPILVAHRLLVLPSVVSRVVEERQTRNGAILYSVTLDVEFTFVSALDGSQHTVRFVGEAMDSGDKASNKAQSAAYKYCLLQCFCIPVEGAQEEADLTTHEETVAAAPPKPEGYDAVRAGAMEASLLGTESLRAFARTLGVGGKDTPEFKAWGYLVKHDPAYALMKTSAESADKKAAAPADAREPGQEG
jgi:hypothetical protein